jgi:luciferase family oxidoreductase group 1
MTRAIRLSVLDVAGVIEDTIELAPLADALGYERYWIAEHQPQPTPILVASIVAGLTQRIRVGTAGILFHYYPPRRTAHDFHFLGRVYEGRIDAGFCGGQDALMSPVEAEGRDLAALIAAYPERVERLVGHLRNTAASPTYDAATSWPGAADEPPQIWSLGGGTRGSELAARLGLHFGYALLYGASVDDPVHVERYRERYVADRCQPEPVVAVAVCGMCAATDAEADAAAAAYPGKFFLPRIVGSAATCGAKLRALAERYRCDEIVFADLYTDLAARKRCYELLATELHAL